MSRKDQEVIRSEKWGSTPGAPEVVRFLEGPQKRSIEFVRAVKIFCEFMRGFRALHFVGPCVTVFGSARFTEGHPYYKVARECGMELAKAGFTVMTGGGRASWKRPIVAPRKSAGGRSAAISSYRKSKNSYAFIDLPGGFGTLDEIFETATLIPDREDQQISARFDR